VSDRALFDLFPSLAHRLRFAPIGELPTPVSSLAAITRALGHPEVELWEKRDDRTSALYGGNKVRTLEVLFGDALERGATHVYATGAYGSNHAAATSVHAKRVGLTAGAMLYPQPPTPPARENLALVLSSRPPLLDLPHWSAFPYGWARLPHDARRRGERPYVMAPGGAVPLGALGYVSAGLELAHQIERGELPRPRMVVVAIGSNCTSAGLLVGFALAAQRRLGFVEAGSPAPPGLVGVRVTPWPITSPLRVLSLAARTSQLLAELVGDSSLKMGTRMLGNHFRVDGRYLGPGYGHPTAGGREAMKLWAEHADHELETTYSGKAAALVVALTRHGARGPVLFWSTKSSAPLPRIDPAELGWAPPRMRRWLG
jgi:D-cysteine desulfhydrase